MSVKLAVIPKLYEKKHLPEAILAVPLALLPWISIQSLPNIFPRNTKSRSEGNMLLEDVQLFLAWQLETRQMSSGGRKDITLVEDGV
jgi:hypothetical protein